MVIARQITLMIAILNLHCVPRVVIAFHNTTFSNKDKSHAFLKDHIVVTPKEIIIFIMKSNQNIK